MAESAGFKEVFRPFLEAKRDQSFPDPSQFTSEADFLYAAKVSSVFKKVTAEILMYVDGKIQEAKHLEAMDKGEIIDGFKIGSEVNDYGSTS